ncbi:MAG: ErfK/YbiS/YcfS/YnhG family [Haloplasmataceae bacterium]|jgi:peptidoglycan hydrolase-like protein with peptidoglycan-binding domain|nr:ErfK/YbiS/YcfS/YnhG family [Haloplasmataceae bacterium]
MSEFFKIGDNGEIVRKVQFILKDLGYNLTIDGNFEPSTEVAVKEFQHKQKIKVDGLVGPKTMELLLLSGGYHPAEAYVNSFNFFSETNYSIWVNLDTHRVNIFNGNNQNWFLINSYIASIPANPTIKGLFKVGEKSKKFKENRNSYFKWITYFFENLSFNSTFNKKKADDQLNQLKFEWSIRLSEENAKYIYDNIPKGSTILFN